MNWCHRRRPAYDDEHIKEQGERFGKSRNIPVWLAFIVIMILLILLVSSQTLYSMGPAHQALDRPCGSSWEEAENKGCKFNIMRHSWLTPACSDEDLTDEFNSIADWQFWADLNRTQPLTIEEVARSNTFVRASPEYMEALCVFSWRKLQRAVEHGTDVEVGLAKLEQATPCQQFIMGRVPNPDGIGFESKQEGQIWFNVVFPKCVSMRTKWYY